MNRPSGSIAKMMSGEFSIRNRKRVLRLAQLALEAVALAHVADAAVGAGEPAGLVAGGERDELGRDRVAVAVEEVDPAAELAVRRRRRRPIPAVQSISATSRDDLVDERPEVLAEELLGAPAGQPLARVRDEREAGVGVDRPDEVRRVLDEVAVARLGLAEQLVQVRVRQRDRGLVGEALEEVELVGQRSRAARRTRSRASRSPRRPAPGAARRPSPGGRAARRRRRRRARAGSAGRSGSRTSRSAGPPPRRGR